MIEELTIGEVAKRAGIRASAIRYYESVQLLPAPQRISGQRRYTPAVLRRLSFIQVAQAAGLTIAEIRTLVSEIATDPPVSERWQKLARQKLAEMDILLHRVQEMQALLTNGLRCRCANLEECIDCLLHREAGG
jgi:MerR family redox-sensitive transcriptional activator SoxR